jgi:hypothetical protein
MNQIEPVWKLRPAAIGGLTSPATFFCLELLARDYGMGVACYAEHSPAMHRRYRHLITGSANLKRWHSRLSQAGPGWGRVAAAMVASQGETAASDSRIGMLDPNSGATVVSWVIAPTPRRNLMGVPVGRI